VKRYAFRDVLRSGHPDKAIVEQPGGEFVRYADVAPLIEALVSLRAEYYLRGEMSFYTVRVALEKTGLALAKVEGEK
jgi:hypothetical protein